MAKSQAHRFGQIIGDLLEDTIIEYCRPIADEYNMYLDYKHERNARKGQKEVRWVDINGNTHKLDIVIEKDGSEDKKGSPRAFIEVAWRRYKKHAKAKAQEISAAIKPLISLYSGHNPFYGAVLAGEFTDNSLNQMKSEGFTILHFSTKVIEDTLLGHGINAHWDEATSEEELQNRVEQMEALSEEELSKIRESLMKNNWEQWEIFVEKLERALERTLESIQIITLYGNVHDFTSIQDACHYISSDIETVTFDKDSFYRYEIVLKYSNGDRIEMQFKEQQTALMQLRQLE